MPAARQRQRAVAAVGRTDHSIEHSIEHSMTHWPIRWSIRSNLHATSDVHQRVTGTRLLPVYIGIVLDNPRQEMPRLPGQDEEAKK